MNKLLTYQATVEDDIGNHTNKATINNIDLEFIPSVYKSLMKMPQIRDTEISTKIDNLFDDLVVHITSPALEMASLYMVGKRALNNPPCVGMNIELGKKYLDDCPIIVSLATIAAFHVQKAYKEHGSLPANIEVKTRMVSNIPASEWTPDNAIHLENRFKNAENGHIVIVYVGKEAIHVNISFVFVKVFQEGVPAAYGIMTSPDDILSNLKELYAINDDNRDNLTEEELAFREHALSLTPEDLAKMDSLNIDIGAGTTEFTFMNGVNPVPDLCRGINNGVGHAANQAREVLSEKLGGNLTVDRHQFDDILTDKFHNHYEKSTLLMNQAMVSETQQIFVESKVSYQRTSGRAKVITVSGGGSIVFMEYLYKKLIDFASETKTILFWVPSQYASVVNRNGLKELQAEYENLNQTEDDVEEESTPSNKKNKAQKE